MFKDLFDLSQSRARLEDFVRIYSMCDNPTVVIVTKSTTSGSNKDIPIHLRTHPHPHPHYHRLHRLHASLYPTPPPSLSSPLQTIQRETTVLDCFITLKVREDVRRRFVDESELHLECEDLFKDLFDLSQPHARLEDLVRI